MGQRLKSKWELWREALWSTYVRLESGSESDDFYGKVEWAAKDCNRLSTVRSTRQLTERTPSHLRSDARELVLLAIQISGYGFVEQDGRQARLDAGDFGLYDTTRPYRLYFEQPFEELIFQLPLAALDRRLPGLRQLTARRFTGRTGAGGVATGFVRQLAKFACDFDSRGVARFDVAAIDLLATAIETQTQDAHPWARAHWERVQARMFQHLRNPDIDLEDIATAEGLSLRGLQRLFQEHSATPTKWVQERRLEGVANDLRTSGRTTRSITDIAFSWGFNDLSHFTRIFRARFGRSPREFRGL